MASTRIAERADHVTACLGGTAALRKPRDEERYAIALAQKIIIFPLTINGLANRTMSSADLSEQLAGA
jgi:hypothetical protein